MRAVLVIPTPPINATPEAIAQSVAFMVDTNHIGGGFEVSDVSLRFPGLVVRKSRYGERIQLGTKSMRLRY